jgi:hypothetical protein
LAADRQNGTAKHASGRYAARLAQFLGVAQELPMSKEYLISLEI